MPPIAHLDMDAFYVSVELQRHPELRGQPVVVAGSGPRAVVTTASYEARRFGVGSAMPASRARRLCPQAVFLVPDFTAYRAASDRVWEVVREQIALVERLGLDEGYLDLDGLMAPRAAMRRLVAQIREATGLGASVGIGPNKLVAKVASDAEKPSGFVILSREEACARFASSPPGLAPGIGPKTVERLAAMGIRTLGELAATPEDTLRARFCPNHGRDLLARAHFHGSAAVEPDPGPAKSRSSETTFDRDIADAAELEEVLTRLARELGENLGRDAARGRTIAIKVRLDDWTTVTRARTLPIAVDDGETIAQVAVELLRAYAPSRPVRLLGVRVASFEEGGAERGEEGQLALPV
jgi:DNA polymerase IV